MDIRRYPKIEIAHNLIETALRLFTEGGDLFSAIALAGAAEEILGGLLQAKVGRSGAFRSVMEVLRPRGRKQPEREGAAPHETALHIHTDAHREAVFLLGRAIDDYQAVTGSLTSAMQRFNTGVRTVRD